MKSRITVLEAGRGGGRGKVVVFGVMDVFWKDLLVALCCKATAAIGA